MTTAKEICKTILEAQCSCKDAQNIGITILDKFENSKESLTPELIELAFYVQSLARSCQSERDRLNALYTYAPQG